MSISIVLVFIIGFIILSVFCAAILIFAGVLSSRSSKAGAEAARTSEPIADAQPAATENQPLDQALDDQVSA